MVTIKLLVALLLMDWDRRTGTGRQTGVDMNTIYYMYRCKGLRRAERRWVEVWVGVLLSLTLPLLPRRNIGRIPEMMKLLVLCAELFFYF